MWRKLRIVILLFVLTTVAQQAWFQKRDLEWSDNFYVTLYPINLDGSARTSGYLGTLTQEQFALIADYFSEEAQRYGLPVSRPFELRLGAQVSSLPPPLPQTPSTLQAMLWSLKFRWWAWRNSPETRVTPKIRLYLLYHDPGQTSVLPHSTALSKGRIGLVNIFGDKAYSDQNAVVIAHELLHTMGASDKYNPATNFPVFPQGFAEPDKEPRYPQEFAELMGGRIPISETQAEIPPDLSQTLIGPVTAQEIRWTTK